MKRNDIIKIFFLLIFLSIFLPCTLVEGAMNNYCIIPPFVSQSIPPNVLIVLDNSGSMCGQAYAGSYDPTQFDKICSDDPTKRCSVDADCSSGVCSSYYYGYFEGPKKYRYSGSGRWEETTDALNTGTVANPVATGSFLNWATMRRDEVAKKLLIGGKANPRSWNGSVTVKLDGETACGMSADFDMEKDFDTSAGDLIYPFVGNYRFTRADNSEDLYIAPIGGATETENRYPNSDIVNGAWTPNSGTTRYTQVDEASADSDTTYIRNTTSNSNDQVIMGYDKSAFSISGVITGVTVVVRAKRSSSSGTMRIQGVLRVKDSSGTDTDFVSSYSNLTSSYSNYNFSWSTNPQSGAAWTFNDLTTNGVLSLTGFGVKAYTAPTSARYPIVTQMYLIVTITNPTGGPYNTIVDMGPGKDARGIIDSLTDDVRFGLAYYAGASSDGARVAIDVDFATPTNMITSIHNQNPSTYTPLGETLYEMARYFMQEPPYYSNSPADYSTGLAHDPYYFDYPDAAITDSYVYCARSYVLLLTDGESTYDQNMPGSGSGACSLTNIEGCSSGYRFAGTPVGTDYTLDGSDFLVDVAFWARTNDMRPGTCTDTPTVWQKCLPGTQNLTLYPIFMFGTGSTLLKDAAIDGGFLDINGNNRPDCLTSPKECYRDSDGDGVVESNGEDDPLTYYEGDDGYALEASIIEAINAILKRASSGTAASVLASGEGSGANIVQAIFYPKRTFVNTELDWTATLQNLWYFIDPNLGVSSIREDTDQEFELELEKDSIVHFEFKTDEQKTKAKLYASDTQGNQGSQLGEVYVEDLNYLWEAGSLLHSRVIGTDPRTIYTTTDGSTRITFNSGAATELQTHLQASSVAEAADIINYVRGDTDVDTALYRNRTVTNGATTGIWRLGDIVNSTPRLVSHIPLHTYDEKYDDKTYKNFVATDRYINRGMVFVGGNDGMLHAIKLGTLELVNNSTSKKAILSGTNKGREEWAFIPKSTLPYLKYLMDKDYCHLYYIDATPYIFDASVGQGAGDISGDERPDCPDPYSTATCKWRTILIGGMRLGGACKDTAYAGSNGVKIPVAGKGYSSYFALDITNPQVPELLWEFNHPELGFSTSGPAIIRINARTFSGGDSVADEDLNGKWFVVFASGPTGPVDLGSHQFKGYSDQPLTLFVFDVKEGPGVGNANVKYIHTGIPYAFGGLLNNGNMDYDRDYQDDVLYLGYTKSEDAVPDANTKWTQGGVIRLITREDLAGSNASGTALNPDNWRWSYVAKDIGSVTSAVAHLAHYPYDNATNPDSAFLYFGSGRYFYKTNEIDNANIQRSLFGIKEPCLTKLTKPITALSDPICDGASTSCGGGGDLADDGSHGCIGNATATSTTDPDGWYITLDPSSGLSCAERVITDPLASTIGAVFFTTFAPNTDICTYGGSTYLWGLKYNTGGTVNGLLQGVALLQVSTGSIEELNLSTAFVEKGEGGDAAKGRRTGARIGAPPTGQGLSILTNPPPVKRVLHIRER
jgi:type IV pilus assembly protein PilY1